ncbi:hypothetical protein II906_11250, partial [bacterium]|nr:hypothetical protein [bacterium]
MKKFKSAFTMTEVLICIFTVGIVITFSLSALRSVENSYTAVTYFVERNINAAIEYIKREKEIGEPGKSSQFMCFDTTLGTLRKYHTMPPDEVLDTTPTGGNAKVPSYSDPTDIGIIVLAESNPNPDGVFTFCEALADVYSTKGEIKCNLDDVFDVSGDDRVDIEKLSGKKDFKKAPNFTLTNGQRFYISKRQAPSSSDKYGYRLIAVDLNGSSAPNITAKIGSKASD